VHQCPMYPNYFCLAYNCPTEVAVCGSTGSGLYFVSCSGSYNM
jgi:hypothetical protein